MFRSIPVIIRIIQNDLKELEKWAAKWGMRFNAKKCYIFSIRQKSSHFYQLDGEICKWTLIHT